MNLTQIGDSVEGHSLALQTRKYLPRIPERDPVLGTTVYPFKLSIFGLAKISTELNPKRPIWSNKSHLNLGDELRGESITGRAEKPLGRPAIVNATGTHKASALSTRGRSFAQIEIGIRALLQRKAMSSKTT